MVHRRGMTFYGFFPLFFISEFLRKTIIAVSAWHFFHQGFSFHLSHVDHHRFPDPDVVWTSS